MRMAGVARVVRHGDGLSTLQPPVIATPRHAQLFAGEVDDQCFGVMAGRKISGLEAVAT